MDQEALGYNRKQSGTFLIAQGVFFFRFVRLFLVEQEDVPPRWHAQMFVVQLVAWLCCVCNCNVFTQPFVTAT